MGLKSGDLNGHGSTAAILWVLKKTVVILAVWGLALRHRVWPHHRWGTVWFSDESWFRYNGPMVELWWIDAVMNVLPPIVLCKWTDLVEAVWGGQWHLAQTGPIWYKLKKLLRHSVTVVKSSSHMSFQ
jgi:hypothetical protein